MEEKFNFTNTDNQAREITITDQSFEFVNQGKPIFDQKFESKPTTFFKDAMKRFVKNKSSVAGAIILGVLVLGALILPAVIPYDVDTNHTSEVEMPAKLFASGTGWWDGTKKYTNIAYDVATDCPDPTTFQKRAILEGSMTVTEKGENFVNTVNTYASGGYVRFWQPAISDTAEASTVYLQTNKDYYYVISGYDYHFKFEILPEADYLADTFDDKYDKSLWQQGEYKVELINSADSTQAYLLKDWSTDTGTIELSTATAASLNDTAADSKYYLTITMKESSTKNVGMLIKSIEADRYVKATGAEKADENLSAMNITDANATLSISDTKANGYWVSNARKNLYKADIQYASFTYDKYEEVYGDVEGSVFGETEINTYLENGWIEFDWTVESFKLTELGETKCPLRSVESINTYYVGKYPVREVIGVKSGFRWLGYDSEPVYMFGTTKLGRDLLKVTFAGLRTSLTLGVVTFLVNFVFGLIWGSISGYFGGAVDLAMERFCDILGGIPWIVMMTLIIINFGSTFVTFAIALCITGWMGTAARTRTQFYRFKGREYILASRTLGASDWRLIFKHILPNAIGTIITGAVLMIPSVIFSEATISYLNLGLQGMQSLGVTLSDNQSYISTIPTLIVFPSTIMALIMISFNLFGNGLRDAFNPSLKGSE